MLNSLRAVLLILVVFINYLLLSVPSIIAGLGSLCLGKKTIGFQWVAQLWANLSMSIMGIRFDVNPMPTYPGPGIFISNHQSYLDILILYRFLPLPFYFVAKESLFKIPLLGFLMSMAGYIPINREILPEAMKSLDQVKQKLAEGGTILIFPEGSRSHSSTLKRFKKGAFKTALEAGVPLFPVVIDGSYAPFRKNIKFKYLEPIDTQNWKELGERKLAEHVQKLFEAELLVFSQGG